MRPASGVVARGQAPGVSSIMIGSEVYAQREQEERRYE